MKLNRTKCEAICIRGNDKIHFADGTVVLPHNGKEYFCFMLKDEADPKRKITNRIPECYLVWERLAESCKRIGSNVAERLVVHDAVVRSKLVYGLESVLVNDSLKAKTDAIQLKCLREALKIKNHIYE